MSETKKQQAAARILNRSGGATDPAAASGEPGPAAMIEQAAAMAVQDAAAHLRNTQTIASAVLGAAEEMLLRDADAAQAKDAIALANAAVDAAITNLERIGALAETMIGK